MTMIWALPVIRGDDQLNNAFRQSMVYTGMGGS